MPTSKSCFRNALINAGIIIPAGLYISDCLSFNEARNICDYLGLEWLENCVVELGVEPVIIVYKTGRDRAHAIFVHDIGLLLGQVEIVGIVRVSIQM